MNNPNYSSIKNLSRSRLNSQETFFVKVNNRIYELTISQGDDYLSFNVGTIISSHLNNTTCSIEEIKNVHFLRDYNKTAINDIINEVKKTITDNSKLVIENDRLTLSYKKKKLSDVNEMSSTTTNTNNRLKGKKMKVNRELSFEFFCNILLFLLFMLILIISIYVSFFFKGNSAIINTKPEFEINDNNSNHEFKETLFVEEFIINDKNEKIILNEVKNEYVEPEEIKAPTKIMPQLEIYNDIEIIEPNEPIGLIKSIKDLSKIKEWIATSSGTLVENVKLTLLYDSLTASDSTKVFHDRVNKNADTF